MRFLGVLLAERSLGKVLLGEVWTLVVSLVQPLLEGLTCFRGVRLCTNAAPAESERGDSESEKEWVNGHDWLVDLAFAQK